MRQTAEVSLCVDDIAVILSLVVSIVVIVVVDAVVNI